MAGHIVSCGADDLLTLKANQGRVCDEVRTWFAEHAFDCWAELRPCFDAFDDAHGQLVRRRVFACPDASGFATLRDWPGLAMVLATETIRGANGTGVVTVEIRHCPSSSAAPPTVLAQAIRRHWAIENDQACYLSRLRGGEQTGCAECKAAMVAASARTSLMGRNATEVERL